MDVELAGAGGDPRRRGRGGAAPPAVHAPATIADAGAPRAALTPAEAKLDAQLRRLVVPEAVPATAFVPVTGAWQQGDAVRVQVGLAPGVAAVDLQPHGLALERTTGGVAEGGARTRAGCPRRSSPRSCRPPSTSACRVRTRSRAPRLDAEAAVPPPTRNADAQCDDGNVCTTDACVGCSCEHRSACDDGDPCTVAGCDPSAGCTSAPLGGFAGVACVCGRDLTAGAPRLAPAPSPRRAPRPSAP